MSGAVADSYAAALRHDLDDPEGTRVGVVRRPTGEFRALVDENATALGPPERLLDETRERTNALKLDGMCEEGAHNAAWDECDFGARYLEHLDGDPAAGAAFDALLDRVADGESVVLVSYAGENKRCHRRLLCDRLRGAL